jgi:hypothetical protein
LKQLSIVELIDQTKDLRNLNFGLKFPESIPVGKSSLPIFTSFRPIEYYERASPTDTQTLSSCESNATCNLIEAWINYHHHYRVNLDYNRLYQVARDMFWKPTDPGGLLLGQSVSAAMEVGLLPPDTLVERIPIDESEIYMALSRGPLVIGQQVSEGWRLSNLSDYGAIAEDLPLIPNAGHATALFGFNIHHSVKFHIILNSWGPKYGGSKGMGGFLAMSVPTSIATMVDRPVSIIPGKMFVEDGNWKDWII